MNRLDVIRVFNWEACNFESSNIIEMEEHIKIYIPLHISLLKHPPKKQDFGAFDPPPFESTFKHCLLRGPQCQGTASYYIYIAKIVVQNQL